MGKKLTPKDAALNRQSHAKSAALKSKVKDAKSTLRRVHVSQDSCSTCGVKMSRTERYESGHNHFDD